MQFLDVITNKHPGLVKTNHIGDFAMRVHDFSNH